MVSDERDREGKPTDRPKKEERGAKPTLIDPRGWVVAKLGGPCLTEKGGRQKKPLPIQFQLIGVDK